MQLAAELLSVLEKLFGLLCTQFVQHEVEWAFLVGLGVVRSAAVGCCCCKLYLCGQLRDLGQVAWLSGYLLVVQLLSHLCKLVLKELDPWVFFRLLLDSRGGWIFFRSFRFFAGFLVLFINNLLLVLHFFLKLSHLLAI